MSTHLEKFARRVQSDSFFLAAPLGCYAQSEHLDDDALAVRIGCDRETLTHLRLCRNPDPMPPNFWQDVERIAAHFQTDPHRLAEIVRFGQGLLQSRAPETAANEVSGYLMAAREDETEKLDSEEAEP
jgi:hypothetical protein